MAYYNLKDYEKAKQFLHHSVETSFTPATCEKLLELLRRDKNKGSGQVIPARIVRRKLNDRAMSHFLLGNTPAVSVLPADYRITSN